MSIDPLLVAWTPAFVIGFVYGVLVTPRLDKPHRRRDDYVVSACVVLGVAAGAAFSMWWVPLSFPQRWGGPPSFVGELALASVGALLRMAGGFAIAMPLMEGFSTKR